MGAADRLTERFDDAVGHLADFPEAGPERSALGDGIRILPVESFVTFYRVIPGWIEVIRILHAARDVTPDMLSE